MSKQALYQKYRSANFEEVVGQEYIVQSIKNAVREHKVGHAYLFCGPRGTGKTTMARLLAKAVNCEHPEKAPCEECDNCKAANNGIHPDIIEINAANETHVEDIRDLIDRSKLAPMQGHHKVYIVDEVHQLSSAASSALLKTLEEPPENVIFVLATTDPQKLLPTIISRCQRFDFTKLRKDQIKDHLLDIAKKENIYLDEEAAGNIAVLCDGGMRDALSIMDQCASYTSDHITAEEVDHIYGLASVEEKINLIHSIHAGNLEDILTRIKKYEHQGIDFQKFTDGMIDILKDVVIYHSTKKDKLLKLISKEQADNLSETLSQKTCMHIIEKMFDSKDKFRIATSSASCFEVICLGLAIQPTTETVVVEKRVEAPIQQKESEYVVPTVKLKEPEKPVEQSQEIKVEQKPAEPIKTAPSTSSNELSSDEILTLLVQCQKAIKYEDDEKFNKIHSLFDMNSKKYTSLLEETRIVASGLDCVVLATDSKVLANRMNEPKMNQELYQFARETLGIDKMLYIATNDAMKDATLKFIELKKAGNLPQPKSIVRYTIEKPQEVSTEDKVKAMFNPEILEIEE